MRESLEMASEEMGLVLDVFGIHCHICGRIEAHLRESERDMVRITGRAHVDCNGHSQYRYVGKDEFPD